MSNKDIDIVYIAVPHGFHYLWISKALKKGKAVLCEKPATLNAEQMKSAK
ncbi:Gfo/Idh/MocA family oxidoreductase [Oenococcus oeni]|nr:Gfo/Idh/MocA family oxidoreductase [Oenococcus oeni]